MTTQPIIAFIGLGHMGGYMAALPRMHTFLDAALADRWAPNSCGWF